MGLHFAPVLWVKQISVASHRCQQWSEKKNGERERREDFIVFVFWYFCPFSSCCLLVQSGGGRRLRDKHKQRETNIKTVDLKGAAALANELRQSEEGGRKGA